MISSSSAGEQTESSLKEKGYLQDENPSFLPLAYAVMGQ